MSEAFGASSAVSSGIRWRRVLAANDVDGLTPPRGIDNEWGVMVFLNGLYLSPDYYAARNGKLFIAQTAWRAGDSLEVVWLYDVGMSLARNPITSFKKGSVPVAKGATVVDLPFSYVVGSKTLDVFVHGILQPEDVYQETSPTRITLVQPAPQDIVVDVRAFA